MEQVETLINRQYQELIKTFRPEFGNLLHIQIAQEVSKLNKFQKDYEAKIEATKDIKELRDSVRKQKRQVLFLLKKL